MTAQKVKLLDDTTINQIAAGEVIENAASVIKELLENALDAGARRISVETRAGGRSLVRVSDDGCGMASDDLMLALERHATSKLTELNDLNSLFTLGFRGEALPSIASVSKMTIHTSTGQGGHKLTSEGGKIASVTPLPRKQGTTIEVKSLFYNVPVRKQFQKSVGADKAEIHKILTKMALCHPKVAFSWVTDGEQQFAFSADGDLEGRMQVLLGEGFAGSMLPVEHSQESIEIRGFCSKPTFHRPNRTGHYLFINGRAVNSPFISRKILEGYGTRLSTHRYPLFVLHLTLPPDQIDVNVHPQKKEVRLSSESELGIFLLEALDKSFGKKTPPPAPTVSLPEFVVSEAPIPYQPKLQLEEEDLPLFEPKRRVIAKVGNYLFVEDTQGVRVVDAAAARLRLAFEELMATRESQAIQQLLIPIQIEVTGAEKTLLLDNLHLFEEVGFSLRHFGEHTFIVDAIPAFFESEEVPAFVHAFLGEGEVPKEKKIARALRKTLKIETRAAGEALVDKLFRCDEPDTTPEGKPTHYLLSEKELAKKFT